MITLMYSNYRPGADHVRRLENLVGAGQVAVADSEESALCNAASTRIVLGHRYLRQILPLAPRLSWVQTTAAGFDQLPWQELSSRGIALSRNPLNAPAIAHHVVALAWALLRRLPHALQAQTAGRWAPPFAMLPLPRKALVLGLGEIGRQTAKLLRGLGLHVRGCANTGTTIQRQACDEFLNADNWRPALEDTDVLVLALPLDTSTLGCVGKNELARLPRHAIVINVARAAIIDQAALLSALDSGLIGGAALDALDPIPPPGDPIWTLPNLMITPKVAAYHPGMREEFERFAESQVRRYLSGVPLEALVNLDSSSAPE